MKCFTLLTIISSICSSCQTVHAQEYRKFRVGVGMGVGAGLQNGYDNLSTNGLVVFSEASYRLNRKVALGVKTEGALTLSGLNNENSITSYSMNAQYYFINRGEVHWFGGLGVGSYHSVYSAKLSGQPSSSHERREIGFYPRVGIDYEFMSLTIDWNIASSSQADITIDNSTTPGTLRNSYLSIKVLLFVSFGKKKSF